jgi:hypothetical protein
MEERIGSGAYRLRFLASSAINPILHVSQLKQYIGHGQIVSPQLPITTLDGQLKIYPHSILKRRAIKHDNVAVPQL